jgi:Uma2 family endonuclease
MASLTTPALETIADLLEQLHVPPERILLRPHPGEATEKDLLKTSQLCELIDGVLVEKGLGFYESRLAVVLGHVLNAFVEKNNLGIVLGEGGLMRVSAGQVRIPDVAFYSWNQFPNKLLPEGQILDFVPDLAVEILSPTNTKKEMQRKRREYFTGGARLVWVVEPESKVVRVFTGPNEFETVGEDGTLDGAEVLPRFTFSIREWFERAGKRG